MGKDDLRCGNRPEDCLTCQRQRCIWDETLSLPSMAQVRHNPTYDPFARALRQARRSRNRTQGDFANELGISRDNYGCWERGLAFPRRKWWDKLLQLAPELAPFAPDKGGQPHNIQPDDGQEAPGRNGSEA